MQKVQRKLSALAYEKAKYPIPVIVGMPTYKGIQETAEHPGESSPDFHPLANDAGQWRAAPDAEISTGTLSARPLN